MRFTEHRRWALGCILGATLGGALVGGLIGMSTGDAVLWWMWLTATAALGAVIAVAAVIDDAPVTD